MTTFCIQRIHSRYSAIAAYSRWCRLVTSLVLVMSIGRGRVEDTRLEAKAKNTKEIRGQGQGQPFRGQTLSRPRTGMLKAKDQGHKRKCSPKKKVFTKIFQAISKKKKGLHKNFSSDLHKKTFSKNFFKRSTKFITSKNSAVLEPRTWGLEAKAKDFKICPRGQGRLRGLHLCQLVEKGLYIVKLCRASKIRACSIFDLHCLHSFDSTSQKIFCFSFEKTLYFLQF